MSDLLSRRGIVDISRLCIEDCSDDIVKFFCGGIVFRCECVYLTGNFEYHMVHPQFDVLEEGVVTPNYNVTIDGRGDFTIERIKP